MIKRITALLTALTVSLAFTSCELRSKSSSSEAEDTTELATFREEKEKETEHISSSFSAEKDDPELEEVREHARTLLSDLKISGNETKLQEDIDILLHDIDVAYEKNTKLMVPYFLD